VTSKGDRIFLTYTSDQYTKLTPGDEGTVTHVDDLGTVHVQWDSGSTLALIPGEDSWRKVHSNNAPVTLSFPGFPPIQGVGPVIEGIES
jgi:hypothetical protein